MRAICIARVLLICALLPFCRRALAQTQGMQEALSVQPVWAVEKFLSARDPLELTLNRSLQSGERLAFLIGTLDVSALLEVQGTRVRYTPRAAKLPAGETQAVVYLVNSGGWQEIARFGLHVRTRLGLDQGKLVPSADLSSNGPLNQQNAAGAPPPERKMYQDFTMRFGVESTVGRSGWQLTAQANALGVTEETQRLRFGELRLDAPPVDLSDYRVQLVRGPAQLSLGNLTIGNHRYLLNGFGSRGAGAHVQLGRVAALDGAMVNGTSVVGWGNPLGLARPQHRMSSATLGLELMPRRPGALHLDFSGFDGSVLPYASFNQGAATDAETSRGLGAQFAVSDATQRIRLAGGFAQSRFRNPNDPLLNGDTTVVAVRPTTRNARFGQLDLQILRGIRVAPAWPLSVSASARHERIDPLYRSVGTSVQADVENNGADLNASFGALALNATLSGARDNLAGISSILTSRTRTRGLNAALPIGSLLGVRGQHWYIPTLNGGWQQIRQFGEGVPPNSDFSATHVPDQMNTVRNASAAWMPGRWTLMYRWNRSDQDNRQTGREKADFRATVHALAIGLTPARRVSGSIDVSKEQQLQLETNTQQRTTRLGSTAQVQATRLTALTGSLSQSWGYDPFAKQRARNTEFHVELTQGFNAYRRQDNGSQGRFFTRYGRTRTAALPFTSTGAAPLVTWTLTAGSSLRLY